MDKDAIIEKQAAEIRTLKETIAQLKEQIARLKEDSSNSSKPPSSDIVKPRKTLLKVSRKKRKRGGQRGDRKFTRQPFEPEQVDEIIECQFKDRDAEKLEHIFKVIIPSNLSPSTTISLLLSEFFIRESFHRICIRSNSIFIRAGLCYFSDLV